MELEEHAYIDDEQEIAFDHHGKEIKMPYKMSSRLIESYPRRTLEKTKDNLRAKLGLTYKLNDFEKQKNQISNQIQELNNSVSKSNLIAHTFVNELPPEASQDLKNLNNQDMTNLNETIKKIFKIFY